MNNKYKIIIAVIVVLLAIFGAYKLIPSKSGLAGSYSPTNSTLSGGLTLLLSNFGDTLSVGNITPGFQVSGNSGFLYSGGGQIEGGGAYSTTTASTTASVTLSSAALINGNNQIIINSATTTTLIVTLPASTTLTNLINVGDSNTVYLYAASSTMGTVTIAGGTGTTLISSSSTKAIPAGGVGILDLIKNSATNIEAILTIAS